MTIIEALSDPHLFGALPAFHDLTSWRPWLAFLRAVYGLPMDDRDLELFRAHTGRQTPRAGGYPEAACIVGTQSGKSNVAALVGVFEAAQAVMAGRRGLYVPLIAQDLRGAQRALLAYVREAVQASEVLRAEVARETADTLELAGGVSLGVYPCRPAAVRGIRAACVVVDELAFFIATDGRPTDREMLRAVRSRVATTGGKLLILSSPYAQAGALWELHRKHHGREDSPTLVWQATAPEMNPTLPADYLARMEAEDPEAYRSEVLGEFRAGISTLFDPEALEACVAEGVRERAPEDSPRPWYVSFVDAASGSGKDAFTAAVAHLVGERAVLDVVRAWRPPFNPSGVIGEAADLLKRYGLRETTGDRYAPGFVSEGFRAAGITYHASERDRSALYLELLPAVNAGRGRVELLDDAELLRELRGLERRRGTSGRDRVDHRPGAHDDRANAAAGAVVLCLEATRSRPLVIKEALWG
ncbi:MAG: hypothetical protein HY317_03185 [Acidobacteria bacterium]|nr:hypothetical protein [Acidobacteriota bacterium]